MSRFPSDRQRPPEPPEEKFRRPPRLYVDASLAEGGTVVLDRSRSHYLANVMRRRIGDTVAVFNGTDGEWQARIREMRRGHGGAFEIESRLRPQAVEPDLWLLMAAVKRIPLDLIAAKATELGVSVLWPLLTRRAEVSRVNMRRMRANAIEAAEQSRRLTVPACRPPATLTEAMDNWSSERALLVCDESGAGTPVHRLLEYTKASAWAILVGPEGGFTDDEADTLRSLPQTLFADLGPRILRSETAAIAALACWQALRGDRQG